MLENGQLKKKNTIQSLVGSSANSKKLGIQGRNLQRLTSSDYVFSPVTPTLQISLSIHNRAMNAGS